MKNVSKCCLTSVAIAVLGMTSTAQAIDFDDLDITIQVIDNDERGARDIINRIELPRPAMVEAREMQARNESAEPSSDAGSRRERMQEGLSAREDVGQDDDSDSRSLFDARPALSSQREPVSRVSQSSREFVREPTSRARPSAHEVVRESVSRARPSSREVVRESVSRARPSSREVVRESVSRTTRQSSRESIRETVSAAAEGIRESSQASREASAEAVEEQRQHIVETRDNDLRDRDRD